MNFTEANPNAQCRHGNVIDNVYVVVQELDEAAVAEFRQRMGSLVRFEERVVVGNVVEEVVSIGKSRDYGLVVVGKGRLPSAMVAQLAVRPAEHPELGPIGDT